MPRLLKIPDELERFVKIEEGKTNVLWSEIARLRTKSIREGQNPDFEGFKLIFDEFLEFLQSQGILNSGKRGSFGLTCAGLEHGPSLHNGLVSLYFTIREDAEAYRAAFYKNAQFSVGVYERT